MENAIRARRAYFPYFFAENQILGCLGGILEASWSVLAQFLGRLGSPRHLQDALKSSKIGPKSLPRPSLLRGKTTQEASKTVQDVPRRFF